MTVTATEAYRAIREEQTKRNSKIIDHVPPSLLKAGKPINIFNVSDMSWTVSLGSLGHYTIHACEPGQKYSKPTPVQFLVPEGICVDMERMVNRYEAGIDVAKDIVGTGPFKHPSQNLTRFGVFIAAGDEPTAEELEAANKAWEDHDLQLIREADAFESEGPNELKNITAQHRKAAERRNVERDWSKATRAMKECPVCGEKVNPNAIIHAVPSCGAVLNEKEVIKRKLKGYEHLWAKQA